MGVATIAVVSVIREELLAAQALLGLRANIEGTAYYVSERNTENRYAVVLTKCDGRGNTPAAGTVKDVIEDFRPAFLLLVGIAGGINGRDVELGDVILADFIEYSEYMKLSGGRSLLRREPIDYPSKYLRARIAEPLIDRDWKEALEGVDRPLAGEPKVIVGTIVAGEKILSDASSTYQNEVLSYFDKGLAVEMESMGFTRAVFEARWSVHYNPQCLVIRGISDLVDVPGADATREQWRGYAAHAAAAFGRAVVASLMSLHGHEHERARLPQRIAGWLSQW